MRCSTAWVKALQKETAKGTDHAVACKIANRIYRMMMPQLAEYANIRDFIACTTYGVLIGAISSKESTKLLYAAQVALSVMRAKPQID
jgi:hypothetical protein